MAKFIELTQHIDTILNGFTDRKIRVNIEHIDFFSEKFIVFDNRAIDVLESYEEITRLIYREL